MKKVLTIILIALIIITGCGKKEKEVKEIKHEKETKEVVENTYKDMNNTPIGIYKLEGNKLIRLDNITKELKVEEDIDTFQIYFSNNKEINLNKSFSDSYYEEYNKYKVKVGFNISFKLKNGMDITYNILTPNNTFDKWEYLMTYLYDDFANKGKSFYSHIENEEYNDSTLFTAIKLQSSYKCKDIDSKINLKVFTYDDDNDLVDNNYRGNSYFVTTINIK